MPWTPNEELYGPGGGDYIDDTGISTPDPWGVLAPQPIPSGVEDFLKPAPMGPPVAAQAHATPAPVTREQDLTNLVTAPIPQPGSADRAPAVVPPVPRPGSADMPPAMIPVTTSATDTTKQTTGLDAASAGKVEAAGQAANAAAGAAGQAQVGINDATAAFERRQGQEAFGRGVNTFMQTQGELFAAAEVERETAAKLDNASKFKPDRTELFQGDRGALFGISAAIAAMAGGWLMGQGLTGGKNPYLDTIMQMIDDNARDQIEQNSTVVQELTRRLGSAQAAQKELKARMLGAVNDTVEAQSRFEKADLVQKGSAAVMAQVQAEQAKNQLDVAKIVAKQETKSVQTRTQTQMVANPAALAAAGGLDVTDPKIIAKMDTVGSVEALLNDAMSLAETGDLAAYTGLVDETVGAVARATQTRTPAQKRVEDFKARLQLLNRADWASEPNGQAIQQALSGMGVPENDAEIPVAIETLRRILNQVDPGGRVRMARRAVGDRPAATETRRIPVVR